MYNGIFYNGIFYNGVFYNGVFYNGTFYIDDMRREIDRVKERSIAKRKKMVED